MTDLYDTEALIVDGIYGDDRMSRKQRDEAMAALAALVAEVERLRAHRESSAANLLKGYETGKAEERAAVVAWLRAQVASVTLYRVDDVSVDAASAGVAMLLAHVANAIERGEHRREGEP